MISSMTGFATVSVQAGKAAYKIELKSLNHRFLDLKIRMPRDFAPLEAELKALLEKEMKRGSVDLWIERQNQAKAASRWVLNEEQAEEAYGILSRLREKFRLDEKISAKDLVSFPEVLIKPESEALTDEENEEIKKVIQAGVVEAASRLVKMRLSEGSRLKDALFAILDLLDAAHDRLTRERRLLQERARIRIKKRIEQCFEAYETPDERARALMETRISQEIAYTLEKLDVEEELTRFKGHIHAVRALLGSGGPVGKKLDFILQELNREVNTLGNKSQDLEISHEVIELKMAVEQMREQSLNLE